MKFFQWYENGAMGSPPVTAEYLRKYIPYTVDHMTYIHWMNGRRYNLKMAGATKAYAEVGILDELLAKLPADVRAAYDAEDAP